MPVPGRIGTIALLGIAAVVLCGVTGCKQKQVASYQGYVEGKFVYVASPQSGRLDHLTVMRGESVVAGRPLFKLDSEPEADEVRQAEQLLKSSRSRLADLETGKRPAEVDVTRRNCFRRKRNRSRPTRYWPATRRNIVPAALQKPS